MRHNIHTVRLLLCGVIFYSPRGGARRNPRTYNIIMLSDRPSEHYETGRWSTAAREFSFARLASLRLVFVFGRRVSIVS